MPAITVDGVELHAESIGSGEPILVLHGGLGMDHTYFRPDFDQLAELGRVVYLDHRGNGRSRRTEDPITIRQLAADAAAVIREIGGAATVIGHSFGGFIAQELAATDPEVVSRLVLLATTPGQPGAADDMTADQGPPPPDELMAIWSRPVDDEAAMRAQLDEMIPYYVRHAVDALRTRAADVLPNLRAMREGFESLATWSVVDRLGSLTMPVLLLAGDTDHFTAMQQSQRIARQVRHADLHVFEDAGHFPWLDQPDAFWSVLRGWLEEPRSGG